jgi:hypothetical protein
MKVSFVNLFTLFQKAIFLTILKLFIYKEVVGLMVNLLNEKVIGFVAISFDRFSDQDSLAPVLSHLSLADVNQLIQVDKNADSVLVFFGLFSEVPVLVLILFISH